MQRFRSTNICIACLTRTLSIFYVQGPELDIEMNAPWGLPSGWITIKQRSGEGWSWYTGQEVLSQASGKVSRKRVNVMAVELQLLST